MVDHVASGLGKLISQYSDSPNVQFLLQTFLEELQEIEDTNTELLLQDSIATAEGVQLDGIGEHLGKRREGLSDVDYRVALNIQKILNAGEGQFSTALQMWRTVIGSPTATIQEEFPAGVRLFSDVGEPTVEDLITFGQALPITVTASLISTYDDTDAFCFFGGDGAGFGTTGDASIGGKFVGRYTNVGAPVTGGWVSGGWDTRIWLGYSNSALTYDFSSYYDQLLSY